jgi:hypothetical protein
MKEIDQGHAFELGFGRPGSGIAPPCTAERARCRNEPTQYAPCDDNEPIGTSGLEFAGGPD